MVTGFFKSTVRVTTPKKPVQFRKDGQQKAMSDIVAAVAPEFNDGASFYVNPLLSSGHAQTAYTALNTFEKTDHVHYKRRILTIDSDSKFYYVKGDKMPYDRWEGKSTIALDYVCGETDSDSGHLQFQPESQKRPLPPRTEYLNPANEEAFYANDRPLMIALHGLAGGSYESYLRAFMSQMAGPGNAFDGLVVNSRGCANHTITSPQLFNGLWTNDLRYVVNEHVRKRWPDKKIFLVGFSLGGSIIANYLGQEGSEVYKNIKGAAIMGSPWDFPQASTALVDTYLGDKVYSPKMGQNLVKLVDTHYADALHVNELVSEYKKNPDKFAVKNLRDFDDLFTSRLFGFNSAQEYYRHASPDQRLLNVRVPTLIVNSKDDPIVGSKSLPVSEVKLNPYTHMVMTTVGGHLGWFDYRHTRWYAAPLARFFAEFSQWEVETLDEEKLPRATNGFWKHDRLVS